MLFIILILCFVILSPPVVVSSPCFGSAVLADAAAAGVKGLILGLWSGARIALWSEYCR